MKNTRQQHGYTLILVLVLLALMAFAVVDMARSSLAAAVRANNAEVELQRRWGESTCKQAILDRADDLFELRHQQYLALFDEDREPTFTDLDWVTDEGEDPLSALRRIEGSVQLGELHFDISLSDEQAKVNLNQILIDDDISSVELAIGELAGEQLDYRATVLQPLPESDAKRLDMSRLPHWEYIFDRQQLQGFDGFEHLTCWGDGRIHFQVAHDDTLRYVLSESLDDEQIEQLLILRRDQPDSDLDAMLSALAPHRNIRSQVKRLMTDQSTCFSMSVDVASEKRSWKETIVRVGHGQTATAMRYRW